MMRSVTARQIADSLGGMPSRILGDEQRVSRQVLPLNAAAPGALTFVRAAGDELLRILAGLEDMTVLCNVVAPAALPLERVTLVCVSNPRLGFMRAVAAHFLPEQPPSGIHPSASSHPTARIDASASIGASCAIGPDCTIGANTVLHPNVTLYNKVKIGANVVVHAGTVIGADGYGYERSETGELEKFPHIGGVIIEDGVEIGSNTSIDRGTLGDTIIRAGAKIDNQCHISHNVQIGQNAAVIAQCMLGGSVRVGEGAWVAPSASVLNQIEIGPRAIVGIAALVVKGVEAGETVMGSPAVPASEFREMRDTMRRLAKAEHDKPKGN